MKAILAPLLIALSFAANAGDTPAKPIHLTLQWSVSLDAAGKILAMKPVDDRNPELYRRLDPEVRQWRFSTGTINGVPAPAESTLTVNLSLAPVDGGYRINLRGAGAGGTYATTTAPKYPDAALMSHRGGAVLLHVDYDAAGRVTDASVLEGGVPRPGNDIERAAVAAVKHWMFRPESIAGHPKAGAAIVPVCFSVQPKSFECRFTDPDTKREIDGNGPLALDPVVRLDSNIADRVL